MEGTADVAVVSACLRALLQEQQQQQRGADDVVGVQLVLTPQHCAILLEDAAGEERRLGRVVQEGGVGGGGDAAREEGTGPRLTPDQVELDHFISPENLVLYYHHCQPPPPPDAGSATTSSSSSTSGPSLKPGDANAKKPGARTSSSPSKTAKQKKDTTTVATTSGQAGDQGSETVGGGDDFNAAKQDGDGLSPMPLKPYYLDLARVLCRWASTGEFPISFVSMDGQGLLATVDNVSPMKALTPFVLETFSKLSASSDTNTQQALLRDLLERMGLRGILTCLRLRQTFKSVDDFPPSCERLIQALNAPHASSSPSTRITVGGRALSKHGHRAADGWWGSSSGAEEVKNKNAERVTRKIFSQAAWINLHMLPHDIATFEVRTKEGYGARWTISKGLAEFRGFIEPQMEDGHDKKWRH